GGRVHIHGSAGDFPGVEMRGGELIIEGEATRPCANMKEGSCVILGKVHDMIPTFEKIDHREIPEWKIPADVYKGDIANRGKGTLMVSSRSPVM
ncbi:MAG TPA: formylmethanofuran dehydrogenase subunit C, partial [Methanoregula sp.]|nr:formylmethanofuran dehydrogenase subunit C [Methanoregula sp.]